MQRPDRLLRSPLRGYGPAVALVVAFVVIVTVVPSTAGSGGNGAAAPITVSSAHAPGMAVTGNVSRCADRTVQVPGDSYSPLCMSFTGDNGGATSRGVTKDTITISYRNTPDGSSLAALESLLPKTAKVKADSPAKILDTLQTLVTYFNTHFQFYGRKLKLVPFAAKGSVATELFGAGQDIATADAVQAVTKVSPFADVSATTVPYAEALTRRKVLALGTGFVSDQWYAKQRPYAWSASPSCSLVTKLTTELTKKQLLGQPAQYAGGALKNKPRKIAVISPANQEYQQCVQAGQQILKDSGGFSAISYSLNLANLENQAAEIVSKLKSEGVTTIACGCDPILPLYLTKRATEQNYKPEWNIIGTGFIDTDLAGQLYDPNQWSRAYGVTMNGAQLPVNQNSATKAYHAVKPNEQPASTAEILYYQLYQLVLGIQMAGPDLTPATFEAGLFAYPEHTGEGGAWKWGPGKYTPQIDAQLVYWDPKKISAFDGVPGSYVPFGPRLRENQVPTTRLVPFQGIQGK